MNVALILWVVITFAATVALGQTQPRLKFEHGVLQVIDLPSNSALSTTVISDDQWRTILSVYTHEAYERNIDQPIAGKYEWEGNKIFFRPAYEFSSGETYHAVFTLETFLKRAGLKHDVFLQKAELSFSIPDNVRPPTAIEAIFPEATSLPENLLRMYICFSNPMMPGEAYDHISLTREDGTRVEKAFLVVDQELWDTERKRFTLLFDPGRIKRGLKSNLDLGAPLKEGEEYHLIIDSTWRDVHGNPLTESVTKTFTVSTAERSKVFHRQWKLVLPAAGSLDDIVIYFDRPMDHALVLKYITIKNQLGEVAGRAELMNDVTWKFTPDHTWVEGEYLIVTSPLLEDVAGNNLNNVFDLDLVNESRVNSLEPIEISLMITGPKH
jgi:hypothetical protein